jgi:hypothetical protein
LRSFRLPGPLERNECYTSTLCRENDHRIRRIVDVRLAYETIVYVSIHEIDVDRWQEKSTSPCGDKHNFPLDNCILGICLKDVSFTLEWPC